MQPILGGIQEDNEGDHGDKYNAYDGEVEVEEVDDGDGDEVDDDGGGRQPFPGWWGVMASLIGSSTLLLQHFEHKSKKSLRTKTKSNQQI